MKIQFLNGGLANQAFQYIFARYYELSHPGDKMYLDDSYFTLNTVHNGYELEKIFGIKAPMLSDCFTKDVWRFMIDEKRKGKSIPQILLENGVDVYMLSEAGEGYKSFNPFDGKVYAVESQQYEPDILNLSGNIYYHGYWIHKNWFMKYQEIFLEEFRFPEITDEKNQKYADQILSSNSVSIHIRRGDYVTLGLAAEPEYYGICVKRFLESVTGKWHLFVFSDDIAWCKEHEKELGCPNFPEYTYIEGNTDGRNYRDLQLMTMCEGVIMSNSAFCFLGALLNTRKRYVLNATTREF